MKVRIINNNFPNAMAELNLNNYIGEILYVKSKGVTAGSLSVELGGNTITIYEGEYEIIEVKEDLEKFMEANKGKYNLKNDVMVKFLLEHRDEIVNILR